MRAVVVGTGTIGSAVRKLLEEHGHDVVSVSRKAGDFQADISDPASLRTLFSRAMRPRTVGLQLGEQTLERARSVASSRGVSLEELYRASPRRPDCGRGDAGPRARPVSLD